MNFTNISLVKFKERFKITKIKKKILKYNISFSYLTTFQNRI